LEEAATLDGCSPFGIYFHIVLPMSRPSLAALGILVFMGTWRDFLGPLVKTNTPDMYTLPVALATFREMGGTHVTLLMAGSVLMMIPMIVVFLAGQRHFGEVKLKISPLPRGNGNSFASKTRNEEIPEHFIPAIEAGVMESLESGVLMGYPVVDVEVVLMGGSFKESVGSELAYRVSASMACKTALSNGGSFLLDPIMGVELFVPEAFMGDVIGDLNARGGKIESIASKTGFQVIRAIVPLAQMFGYSTSLRSATQGRGTFSMQFSHFDRSDSKQ
jgi:hypothetical protein